MKNKIIEIVNSIAVLVLFLSLGMYDSEDITIPAIMSLTSICWILLVTNRDKVSRNRQGFPWNLEEMRTLYRLVYKNGDHGAWDDDIERIRKYAKFFHAEIESREFKI